jgi:hypothetical protein
MTENMDNTQATNTETVAVEETQSQEQTKMLSQDEVNDIIAKRIAQVKSKYDGVDLDEYKELKSLKQQQDEQQLIKRNEFEKLLKQTKTTADVEVNKLRGELEKIKVDGALINSASKAGSVNPEHIAQLLRNNIKLDAEGNVNVVDTEGQVRYTDGADPMGVNDLVNEFLESHTYYRTAGPSGTGSESNKTAQPQSGSVSLKDLDLSKPEARALYNKMKQSGKL